MHLDQRTRAWNAGRLTPPAVAGQRPVVTAGATAPMDWGKIPHHAAQTEPSAAGRRAAGMAGVGRTDALPVSARANRTPTAALADAPFASRRIRPTPERRRSAPGRPALSPELSRVPRLRSD